MRISKRLLVVSIAAVAIAGAAETARVYQAQPAAPLAVHAVTLRQSTHPIIGLGQSERAKNPTHLAFAMTAAIEWTYTQQKRQ